MKKRLFAWLLALALCLSLAPLALAEEAPGMEPGEAAGDPLFPGANTPDADAADEPLTPAEDPVPADEAGEDAEAFIESDEESDEPAVELADIPEEPAADGVPEEDVIIHDAEKQGTLTTGVTWVIEGGTLTISGEGAIPDNEAPWRAYNADFTRLVIEEGITSIGSFAFYDGWNIKKFDGLPAGVTAVGEYAFAGAFDNASQWDEEQALWVVGSISLTIPASMETIGRYAFAWGSTLRSVTFSEGVRRIGEGAFRSCTQLRSVTLPASLEALDTQAFAGCDLLEEIHVLNPFCDIDTSQDGGEWWNNVYTLGVPGVTTVFGYAESTAQSAAWGEGGYLFAFQELDSGIFHPAGFSGTLSSGLTWSIVNGTLTITGEGAIPDDESPWRAYSSQIHKLVLGDGITAIGKLAFSHLYSIVEFSGLPAGLISIGDYAFESCFCTNGYWDDEQEIWVEHSVSVSIPASVEEIGEYAFAWDYALSGLTFSEGIESIGAYAFYYCSDLKNVTLPASLEVLGSLAFGHCDELEDLYILNPDCDFETTLNPLDRSYVFQLGSPDVTTVHGAAGSTAQDAVRDDDGRYIAAFREIDTGVLHPAQMYGTLSNGVSWAIEDDVLTISGDGPIPDEEGPWQAYPSRFTKLVIGDGITAVGDFAFYDMNNIEAFDGLPEGVTRIGRYAFGYCFSSRGITWDLESTDRPEDRILLNIPASVTEIDDCAFYACRALFSATLSENLTRLGFHAFGECISLKELFILNPQCAINTSQDGNEYSTAFTLGVPGSTMVCGFTGSTAQYAVRDADGRYIFTFGEFLATGNEDLSAVRLPLEDRSLTRELRTAGFANAEEIGDAFRARAQGAELDIMAVEFFRMDEAGSYSPVIDSDELPEEGLELILTYPEGSDPAQDSFQVYYIVTEGEDAGTVKTITPRKTEQGLEITVRSLSPVAVVWTADEPGGDDPGEEPTPAAPQITIAGDGMSARLTGEYEGLYVRVALVLDAGGTSGLYIAQGEIGADGLITLPALALPGLVVQGVSVTLVRALSDIPSTTPTPVSTAFKML